MSDCVAEHLRKGAIRCAPSGRERRSFHAHRRHRRSAGRPPRRDRVETMPPDGGWRFCGACECATQDSSAGAPPRWGERSQVFRKLIPPQDRSTPPEELVLRGDRGRFGPGGRRVVLRETADEEGPAEMREPGGYFLRQPHSAVGACGAGGRSHVVTRLLRTEMRIATRSRMRAILPPRAGRRQSCRGVSRAAARATPRRARPRGSGAGAP